MSYDNNDNHKQGYDDPFDLPPGDNRISDDPFDLPPGDRRASDDPFDIPPGGGNSGRVIPINNGSSLYADTEALAKYRKKLAFFNLIATALGALIAVIFMCTPFIYATGVNADGTEFSAGQIGFALFGAIFNGKSALAVFSVPQWAVREGGVAYAAALLLIALSVYNAVWKYRHPESGDKGLFWNCVLVFTAAIFVFAFGILARKFMSPAPLGSRITGVYYGVFGVGAGLVLTALSPLVVMMMHRIYASTHRGAASVYRKRKAFNAAIAAIVICVLGLEVATVLIEPNKRSVEVGQGESGYATLFIDESFADYYVGATVFRLNGMEEGGIYRFMIRSDQSADDGQLADILGLCYYYETEGMSAYELYNMTPITTNDSYNNRQASVTFTCDGFLDLAVVLSAAATQDGNLNFTYIFERLD